MSAPTHQATRNLAARMGRWSADHWKTATFGWLALVVVAFGIGGMVGTKNIDPNTSGPGESGRMDRILDAGFKQPAGESVLDPEPHRSGRHARVRRGGRTTSSPASRRSPVRPLAARTPPKVSKDGHAVLVDFDIARRQGQGRRQDRARSSTPSPPPRQPIRASSSASSATRARRRRSRTRTATIWARRGCSRSRSRC